MFMQLKNPTRKALTSETSEKLKWVDEVLLVHLPSSQLTKNGSESDAVCNDFNADEEHKKEVGK